MCMEKKKTPQTLMYKYEHVNMTRLFCTEYICIFSVNTFSVYSTIFYNIYVHYQFRLFCNHYLFISFFCH